jgi:hypothetical protein
MRFSVRRLPTTAASTLPRKSGHDFLKEIDMFFAGRGHVQQCMRRLVRELEKAGISYVLVGGLAVNAHGHERMTKDVDVLMTREGFKKFCQELVPRLYDRDPRRSRRFVDRKTQRTIDVLVTGMFPGRGEPGPIAFPDPGMVAELIRDIRVVNLTTLIQLKLAARRHQDFADVVNLIAVHNLDESFGERLHSTVRRDFIECLEEKRREEAYLAREE